MNATTRSFVTFTKQMMLDGMLIMMIVAPILAGIFFRFGIPVIETLLTSYYEQSSFLTQYYVLFDLFMVALAPYMFCFAASMTLLDEYDTNITQHLIVTPIGKKGYLISRLFYTTLIAIGYSFILLMVFSLTTWGVFEALMYAVICSFLGISLALALFSFSKNKVEGLALAKLAGLFLMGLPVPFLVSDSKQYLVSFLPSFWMAKLKLEFHLFSLAALLVTGIIWYIVLYRKFIQKLSK